jgi:pilus assembly protein CpaC
MTRRETTIRISTGALLAAALWAITLTGAEAQNSIAATAQVPAVAGNAEGRTTLIGNAMRLSVGQSMFVSTVDRLRKVYISNPDVLDSITSTPHQIVVTGKAPGVSSLILWDESGQSQAYHVAVDLDVDGLRNSLKEAFPYENIQADGRQDQVALAGTVSSPAVVDQAVKIAGNFSKTVVNSLVLAPQHTPQVRLKVRVVEIDRTRAKELGFNFFTVGKNSSNVSTGQFPAITVASTASSGTSQGTGSALLGLQSLLSMFYYNEALGIGAAIEALENKQIIQILAEPTLSAVSGEKASFLSGGEFPFPVIQPSSGGYTSVTIQFRPYGVRLDFTPLVLPDGTIQLKVAPEVSALDYTNEVEIAGYIIPAISTRRADTEVELKTGQSFMISGLLDNRTTDQLEKIPGIGDIPVLGKLFQTKSSTHSVVELAVIVTPTLVDPLSENAPAMQPKMVIPFVDPPKFDKPMVPKTPPAQPQPQPMPQDVPVVEPPKD